ncbi:MAG: dihydrofolate reductase [Hyphomicrobiales bacterium]|nr:dihydrofolate reductase [Hyphomicrobiales bacterium]MCP5373774.1 dihydrofolate reductase [Hyphomicrobiales bacterium]
MRVSLVVAVAENGVIGRDGGLPWRLPGDLAWFKKVTMGKPIIMGRKTYDSIGRPLPGRTNIVVTRNPDWRADGVAAAPDLDTALARAAGEGAGEAMVIGGAQIYAQAIELADRYYLTEVHAAVEGDTSLPPLDRSQWVETFRERHAAAGDAPAYSFVILDRRVPPAE